MTDPLAYAIVGHLFGDYIVQNDWMAVGKKTNSAICSIHCSIWAFCVMFAIVCGSGVPDVRMHNVFLPLLVILYGTHFIQDRTQLVKWWMTNISGQKDFFTKLGPWSGIVVDNVLHLVVVAVVCHWFTVHVLY